MVDIPGGTVAEDRNKIFPEPRAERRFEIIRIVGADQRPFGRVGMKGEIGQRRRRCFGFGVPEQEEGEFRIDSGGRMHFVGIVETGIEPDRTVFHHEPAVKRNTEQVLLPLVEDRGPQVRQGRLDGRDPLLDKELFVVDRLARVDPVILRHRPRVEVFADRPAEEGRGMGMGRADDDRFARDAVFPGNRVPDRVGRGGRNRAGVRKHQNRGLVSLTERQRLEVDRVVHSGRDSFVEIAAQPEPDRRRDFNRRRAAFQRGGRIGAQNGGSRENERYD